jgi:hypothetical protein
VCVRRTQASQMRPSVPATSFLTCCWFIPQKEHVRRPPRSGTCPLYARGLGNSAPAGGPAPQGNL